MSPSLLLLRPGPLGSCVRRCGERFEGFLGSVKYQYHVYDRRHSASRLVNAWQRNVCGTHRYACCKKGSARWRCASCRQLRWRIVRLSWGFGGKGGKLALGRMGCGNHTDGADCVRRSGGSFGLQGGIEEVEKGSVKRKNALCWK